jgi:glucose-1-phosphate adenylyltransferase
MIKMISLILGGGAGTRLFPLTAHRSKPAVPIGGKYRLIDIPISNCLNSGVRRMFVVTQYNSASLNAHIKNTYNFDMFSHGFVEILAAEQTPSSDQWFQGTADAVRQSMHHLNSHEHDQILILSGDQLYQMHYEKMAEEHVDNNVDLTIATIPVNAHDAPGFGIMKVNEQGLIESFIEKPKTEELGAWHSPVGDKLSQQGRIYLASMGIYIFKKEVMKDLLAENPKAIDFGKEIIPYAIEKGYKVASHPFDGYWTDIGTIRSFFDANIALTKDVPEFNLFGKKTPVYTRPRLLAPSKISGTWLNQAIIADGCIIHAQKIEHTVVGIRARIGKGTDISNSIVMGNDSYETLEQLSMPGRTAMGIGANCFIRNAIIDKDVRIGDNVHIHGSISLADDEQETHTIKDGIIVVKKGVYIPAGTRIGLNA